MYALAKGVQATTGASINTLLPAFVLSTTLVAVTSAFIVWDATQEIMETGRYDGKILLPAASALVATALLATAVQGVALAPKPVVNNADATTNNKN